MQNFSNKDSALSSSHSTSPYVVSYPSWEYSTESNVPQSSMSESLSLKMGVLPQHFRNTTQLSFQLQDQDSSSTQSTGQSYPEVASMGESSPRGQSIVSVQSGYNETHGKPEGGQTKIVSSMGPQEFFFPLSQVDYNQSVACVPVHYADPCFSGLLAASYGPQAIIHHPQLMGMASARVPLPLEFTKDEPIYVNAKQYRAILRRRQYRAKLEAQNKIIKGRKPYLHESRHLHALKRARGSGGRFLNMKSLQESKPTPTSNGVNALSSPTLHLTGTTPESEVHQPEHCRDGASTTSCSEVTSASNSDDMFQQQDFRFCGYLPHITGAMQGQSGNMSGGGNQHRFSVLR